MHSNNIANLEYQGEDQLADMNLDMKNNIYHVPSFLVKLYDIVDNPKNHSIISWTTDGDGFQIMQQNMFCDYILP